MKTQVAIVGIVLAILALWGCPSRRYIPDPLPPQPKVQVLEETPGFLGRVPPAGLRIYFKRMLA